MTIVAASTKARGSVGNRPGAVSVHRYRKSDRASGALLTGPCLRGQCQDGPSRVPVMSAAPAGISRVPAAHKEAPAQFDAAGRMSHRGEVDEQHTV